MSLSLIIVGNESNRQANEFLVSLLCLTVQYLKF